MVNKIIIQGRLTKEPDLKQTQSGIPTLLFTVAWSEKYKEVETSCFLLCRAWRQTAEFIGKWFGKGSEILIEGHMVTEAWKDEKVTFCLVDKAHFCGPKKKADEGSPYKTPPADDGFMKVDDNLDDEELPFE